MKQTGWFIYKYYIEKRGERGKKGEVERKEEGRRGERGVDVMRERQRGGREINGG